MSRAADSPLDRLRTLIGSLARDGERPRTVNDVSVFSTTRTTAPLGTVTEPTLAVVAQGAKESALGDRVYGYSAGRFLVVTVGLPLTSRISAASRTEPFLAASLPLEPATVAELLLEAGETARDGRETGPALATSDASDDLLDAFVRLLRLPAPADERILAPAIRREIHWRLLTGPQGPLVRQIGLADGRLTLVTRAITWLRAHYDEPIRMDDLAAETGLAPSTLNRHFRAVTSMSPLQYLKRLRLHHARTRLLADTTDIAGVGLAVGYTSASQFTREYHRMFGAPPREDAVRLRAATVVRE